MLQEQVPASVPVLPNMTITVRTSSRHAKSLPGNRFQLKREFVFDETNVLDGGGCQDEILGYLAGNDDTSYRGFAGEVLLHPAYVS